MTTIAIVGAGYMGTALAYPLVDNGHAVPEFVIAEGQCGRPGMAPQCGSVDNEQNEEHDSQDSNGDRRLYGQ